MHARGGGRPDILAIGPMTRGDLWNVVAVPDIRVQVSALARRLVKAHGGARGFRGGAAMSVNDRKLTYLSSSP